MAEAAVTKVVPNANCLARSSAPLGKVASSAAPISGNSAVIEIQFMVIV